MNQNSKQKNKQTEVQAITLSYNVLTIDSSVEKLYELVNSGQHLFPGEIQQRNHSEAKLLQEVGQLMYIHNWGHQVWMVRVIQIANKEGNFIGG